MRFATLHIQFIELIEPILSNFYLKNYLIHRKKGH